MIRTIALAVALAVAGAAQAQTPGPYASAGEQQVAMSEGRTTSEALVRAYLERIERLDRAGPKLNAVLALNPNALADARRLDAERKAGRVRGPLHGVPILIKDNIETRDGTATTAGSLALAANIPEREAPVVARLREAGAVILGKANLSEWANFRSTRSISGWSAVGGLVRNPHSLDRTACGSSSGSGAAVAAGLATAAIGTETDGSITCPAAMTGVVGLKPTVGLVSRAFIVPISPAQDTAGPMTRTVADAAALLTAIAEPGAGEEASPAEVAGRRADYAATLKTDALKGARIGVWHPFSGRSPAVDQTFERAQTALRAQGAVLVEVTPPEDAVMAKIGEVERDCLRIEFEAALNAYLATTPAAVKTRTLKDLIAFNRAEPRELALFGQEIFEAADGAGKLPYGEFIAKCADGRAPAREELDRMLAADRLDAIVAPSGGPPSIVDPVNGGPFFGSPSRLPAVSGYPHLTVPMGEVSGLPVGLSFIGPAWSEARLLALGHAFELATRARVEPQFLPNVAARPEIGRAYDP